uniref:G protein signaling modulator 1a n=1 Tax=Mastacembelus armatus TaxID=205130 RepID=A0A3Q3S2C9_9TELE
MCSEEQNLETQQTNKENQSVDILVEEEDKPADYKQEETANMNDGQNRYILLSYFSTVVFSSMTSLQKEEFFELVATAQARRLDDQRAHIKQLSFVKKPAPAPVPKEDLYNMILTTQAQGRLEDQRSRAPGPMDDEDFFSLLLRVQGGRMDEQRTELPCMLQT